MIRLRVTGITEPTGPALDQTGDREATGTTRHAQRDCEGGTAMGSMRGCALARGIRAALGGVALLLAFGQAAEARVVTVRWSHPSAANVGGFRVHYGTSSGNYTSTVNVGKPSPSGGVYTYDLTVGDTATVYVALTAYGSGYTDSQYSNEKTFAAPTPPPPTTPIAPPSGGIGTWSSDFQTSPTGTVVSGWLDTGADNSLTESDSLFSVLDVGGTRAFGTSSTLTNIHAHYVAGTSSQWTSYQLVGRMRVSDASAGIGVTAYSQYPSTDKYYRLRRLASDSFTIVPHGTTVSCTSDDTGVVPAVNAWYRFRFEVTSSSGSNAIRAKVWQEGSAEPGSWQASCTDSSGTRPTRGTVGVWSMGNGQKAWDDLAVYLLTPTTAPGPPPSPILIPE